MRYHLAFLAIFGLKLEENLCMNHALIVSKGRKPYNAKDVNPESIKGNK